MACNLAGRCLCERAALEDARLEQSLFKYSWRFSRSEQLAVLALIAVSLPFYWVSFEIPKRIVNDAIQGRAFAGGHQTAVLFNWSLALPDWLGGAQLYALPGLALTQHYYLLALSGLFLLFVLINGWFKYVINIRKGILGERMLRRLRFDLFSLLLRFPPEDVRAVKAAEVAGMIKDEVDPIGGFIGDAFIQPAFLGTQAITALLFIMLQNWVMGGVALAIVLVQGIVIPRLRVEQLRLGRERQLASRQLAGRIGEIVEGAPAIHANGAGPVSAADIGGRLGHLFDIRVDLFRRKFFVKFLNNLLAQVTPFFFYAIGGYFALKQQLDIGQLVAVIAAYRDLPPPIKELIDWDQQRNDVQLKYEQVVAQFSPAWLLPPLDAPETGAAAGAPAEIAIQGLRVAGSRGAPAIDRATLKFAAGRHIAVAGEGGAPELLLKVLGRQSTSYGGRVEIAGQDLRAMSDASFARLVAYAGPEVALFPGSIRDNIVFSLRRCPPVLGNESEATPQERLRRAEARLTGNPEAEENGDWIDYAALGAEGEAGVDLAIFDTLRSLEAHKDVYRLGLYGRLAEDADPALPDLFVAARASLRERLEERKLSRLVESFDPASYHDSSSVAENLLFGVARGERLAAGELAGDPYFRSILQSEALLLPLAQAGLDLARWTVEIFGGPSTQTALGERFSLFRGEDMEAFRALIELAQARGDVAELDDAAVNRLVSLTLQYIEPQHRLGIIDAPLKQRLLRARKSFRRFLPREYQASIEFYDPARFNTAAPILDNLLFGRIATSFGNAEKTVSQLSQEVLREQGLDKVIFRIGLERPVGLRGRLLDQRMRTIIDLARGLVKRPKIVLIDGALASFGAADAGHLLDLVRTAAADALLVATLPDGVDAHGFDETVTFDNGRMQHEVIGRTAAIVAIAAE